MTGPLHEKEFSASFIKGGGALIVGFAVAGALGADAASRADLGRLQPARSDAARLVLAVNSDNTVRSRSARPTGATASTTGVC